MASEAMTTILERKHIVGLDWGCFHHMIASQYRVWVPVTYHYQVIRALATTFSSVPEIRMIEWSARTLRQQPGHFTQASRAAIPGT
jgi:hypothetical protein